MNIDSIKKMFIPIFWGSLLEFVSINIIYCIHKLLLFDCSLIDIYSWIAVGAALIASGIISFYHFKEKSILYYVFEPIVLAIILLLFFYLDAPIVSHFAHVCEYGDWFSGINYVIFIYYYSLGRIVLYIISLIASIICFVIRKKSQ